MDNWDYKFQHPVIVRRRSAEVVPVTGYAEAVATTPDAIKNSNDPANTYFASVSTSDDVYSNERKIILKLAKPVFIGSNSPCRLSVLTAIGAASVLAGHQNQVSWSAPPTSPAPLYCHFQAQPIVEDFDLDVDTSWNGVSALSTSPWSAKHCRGVFDANGNTIYGQGEYASPGLSGTTANGTGLAFEFGVYPSTSPNVNVYGFILTNKMDAHPGGTISSVHNEVRVFPRNSTGQSNDYARDFLIPLPKL